MKRLLTFAVILLSVSVASAYDVWKSSTPATATTGTEVRMLCPETQRGIFHGVCTSFGVASASMTVVNSTYTLSGVSSIGPISTLVADQCKYYDVMFPKGLGYNKPNTATATILYECK